MKKNEIYGKKKKEIHGKTKIENMVEKKGIHGLKKLIHG